MPGTLRDDILAIPGIDDAHLEGEPASPDGVRVRLSYGADPQRVGREVRRILALHGMRSQLTEVPDQVAPAEPPPPPPPAGTVVNLSDYENGGPTQMEAEPDEPEVGVVTEPAPEAAESSEEPEGDAAVPEAAESAGAPPHPHDIHPAEATAEPEAATTEAVTPEAVATEELAVEPAVDDASEPEAVAEPPDEAELEDQVVAAAVSGLPALGNVAVIEGASGVTVTASTRLGKTKSRTAPVSPTGVDRAIVSAVSRLLVPEQDPPLLVEIMDADRDGELILTVVLELEAGEHAVGSAIQAANRPWALARATRAALNVPE